MLCREDDKNNSKCTTSQNTARDLPFIRGCREVRLRTPPPPQTFYHSPANAFLHFRAELGVI